MDRLARYLDPTAAVTGVVVALGSAAVGIPAAGAAAIGAIAMAIANVGVVLMGPRPAGVHAPVGTAASPARLPASEDRWIRRGDDAVAAIRQCVRTLGDGALKDRLAQVARDAQHVLDDLRTLAIQAAATRDAGQQLEASRLSTDLTRLTTKLERCADAGVEEDLRRSLEAVREQLRIGNRLEAARKVLLARIESCALGLQQTAAQVSEMVALASPGAFAQQGQRIDELNAQLEALRAGLDDAGALSHLALGALDPEGGNDDPRVP